MSTSSNSTTSSWSSSPTKGTRPSQPPSQRQQPARPEDTSRPLATHTVAAVLVLLLALATGFFAPHLPYAIVRILSREQVPGLTLRSPIVFQDPPVCPKPEQHVEFVGTFNRNHKRSMALADQAKKVAAEFDFSDDAVNKAVKEFIREMGRHGHAACWQQSLTRAQTRA